MTMQRRRATAKATAPLRSVHNASLKILATAAFVSTTTRIILTSAYVPSSSTTFHLGRSSAVSEKEYIRVVTNQIAPCRYTRHFATVYSPDGNVFAFDEEEDDGPTDDLFGSSSTTIAERLTSDASSSLARLAVAFSPPGRELQLRQLEKVEVLAVDDSHIEIVAVVKAENGGGASQCVSLLVPVTFPHPCAGASSTGDLSSLLEECVMDNIGELDDVAKVRILELEEEEEEERQRRSEEEYEYHLNDDDFATLELPSWWTTSVSLADDCETVRSLLNGEAFQDDVQALAQRGLEFSLESQDNHALQQLAGADWTVRTARVAALGTSGLVLRARIRRSVEEEDDEVLMNHHPRWETRIVEVPYPFGGHAAAMMGRPLTAVSDAEALRAAVLGTVAEIHAT